MKIEYSVKTNKAIEALNKAIQDAEKARLNGEPYAEKGGLKDAAKAAARAVNEAIMADALNILADRIKTEGPVAVVQSLMDDWTVDGFGVTEDSPKKGGAVHATSKTLRISYSALDAASRVPVASNGGWRHYMAIFAANAAAHEEEVKKGEEAALRAVDALPAELLRLRDARGGAWKKRSHSALVVQLNELVAMMLPEGFKMPKMLSGHMSDLYPAIVKWVDHAENVAAHIKVDDLNKIENRIMTMIMTRYKDLAVRIETGLSDKSSNKPNTPAADEGKGGDVESGTTPAPAAESTPAPVADAKSKPAPSKKGAGKSSKQEAA